MSKLTLFKRSREPSDIAGETDIDVTPIMNMFIILIPFLVSMAVFTRLAIIEFKVPSNAGAGLSEGKPKMKLTLVVKKDHVLFTRGADILDSLWYEDKIDPKIVKTSVEILRDSVEVKDEVILAVNDDIIFDEVVSIMDVCKESGFEKVGLSSSAE